MTATDSAPVRRVLEQSADPISGRAALTRLTEAHPYLLAELATDAVFLEAIVAVSVASHSLLAVLERDEGALAMLRAGALSRASAPVEDLILDARRAIDHDDPLGELRRWKHRNIVRVAGRDLLAIADLRTVGAELSGIAHACLSAALEIAAPAVPMAVIAMGKLGGAELNYSSDVDILFVHDGDSAEADRAARARSCA